MKYSKVQNKINHPKVQRLHTDYRNPTTTTVPELTLILYKSVGPSLYLLSARLTATARQILESFCPRVEKEGSFLTVQSQSRVIVKENKGGRKLPGSVSRKFSSDCARSTSRTNERTDTETEARRPRRNSYDESVTLCLVSYAEPCVVLLPVSSATRPMDASLNKARFETLCARCSCNVLDVARVHSGKSECFSF